MELFVRLAFGRGDGHSGPSLFRRFAQFGGYVRRGCPSLPRETVQSLEQANNIARLCRRVVKYSDSEAVREAIHFS